MKEIDTLYSINFDDIDYKNYFQSLIDIVQQKGILSQKRIQEIQNELFKILTEQIDKWNNGESSSIRTEKAQDIFKSIFFVIGVELKSSFSPSQSIEYLRSTSMQLLYEKGLKRTQYKEIVSRQLQKRILDNLVDSSNKFYQSTVEDAINGFFKLYSPQFSAHEIHITADYPTFFQRPELNGVEFIEKYLRYIEAENSFCSLFSSEKIHHVLSGITPDYSIIPINIFEPVLSSSLGLILTKHNPKGLNLSISDIEILYFVFKKKSVIEIKKILEEAFNILENTMSISSHSKSYIFMCLPKLAKIIEQAISMNTLEKVFVLPVHQEKNPKIFYSYGKSMSNKQYQKILAEVSQVQNSHEKVEFILQRVHSLADLLDILSDVDFQLEDFEHLVNILPLLEFSLLLFQYPTDAFLDRTNELLLYEALQKRKQSFTSKEERKVNKMLNAFQNGEGYDDL